MRRQESLRYPPGMGWGDSAVDLLAGPRGRRMCWSLVNPRTGDPILDGPCWLRVWHGGGTAEPAGLASELAAAVALADLDQIAAETAEIRLLEALAESIDAARYWQGQDAEDQALEAPEVAAALMPVAQALGAAPAARWWSSPMASDCQRYVQHLASDRDDDPPHLSGAAASLARWKSDTLGDERAARKRPSDPEANWSGYWWSSPVYSVLVSTTRSLPRLGAVGLALVEDSHGWTDARCWPLAPQAGSRIYEISGPEDWADLVTRYPLDLTRSRRHDWWRVTGWSGRWLVPDFAAAAADYDAVHLSVIGYLTTAGRVLPVGDARTMLAGWDPDQTWWLSDVLSGNGSAERWVTQSDEPLGWNPAPESSR
jgi:hypothetical protein